MITSTGHVHCGFEIVADRRRQAIEGSADINPNLIQLSADFLVGFQFLAPLDAHGFHEAFVFRIDLADLSRVEVYQLLGLILREPKFSEQGGCSFNGSCVESLCIVTGKQGLS